MSREADRRQLPALMRRDVRLLGDLLGEAIRESGGQDLLDDVERLRRAVIAARESPPGERETGPADGEVGGAGGSGWARSGTDPVGDEIAAMVGGWPLARAELVAKAFTIYFHLTNLAEERQRVRVLRGEGEASVGVSPGGGQAGGSLRRESLAAAVAQLGGDGLDSLLGGLRVHPVLTAHPTEARRRAVATGLRRIAGLVEGLDHTYSSADQAAVLRRLREEIQLLWLTAPLRVKPMGPIDEVRSVMAVFDETLFTLAPAVYRALDQAWRGVSESAAVGGGRRPRPPPHSWRRPGWTERIRRLWFRRSCVSAVGSGPTGMGTTW